MNFANDSVITGLIRVLEKGNDKQKLWALQKTREHLNIKLFDSLIALLDDTNGLIRQKPCATCIFTEIKMLRNKPFG